MIIIFAIVLSLIHDFRILNIMSSHNSWHMLIENDILDLKKIFIDKVNSKAIIFSCNDMIISIEIKTLSKDTINKILYARFITIISFHFMTIIFIHHSNLSNDRDFFFESFDSNVSLYAHAIDFFTNCIMIKNDSTQSIKIFRNARLDRITKIQYLNVFHVDSNVKNYVERKSTRVQKSWWFNRVLKTAVIAYITVIAMITTSQNVVHSNDVTIHNLNLIAVSTFKVIVNNYFNLWKSEKFVKLSMNQWMRIFLKSDWKVRIFEKIKVYSLETENKKLVNQIFDDLQAKKRLKYTVESILFSYLVFVIWKMINEQRKSRMIIDIRKLNAITLSNAYLLSLQKDITSTVKECQYLSIIDCASFFYQWRVHSKNRHKLTVVSHREQKTFQITMMNYKNSSFYVQRQMNCLFRDLFFVKAFYRWHHHIFQNNEKARHSFEQDIRNLDRKRNFNQF
jgi:hypothetical protein